MGRRRVNTGKLREFIIESNKIEGIYTPPSFDFVDNVRDWLQLNSLISRDLLWLAEKIDSSIQLRDKVGLNVIIGKHVPLLGGNEVVIKLESLLTRMNQGLDPYIIHKEFEKLHPFTNGNGRIGRLIWLWQMLILYNDWPELGFLCTWYYQSLI